MFNILVDLLPRTVNVKGTDYPINTDFRTSILFEQMAVDPDIDDEDRWRYLLDYYYEGIKVTEDNLGEFVSQALKFYKGDKEENASSEENSSSQSSSSGDKIYDYDYDSDYIYSAFLQQYGIDLQDIEYLHWWKFRAMFNSLKEDCKFCKILEYRSVDLNKVKDEEQKQHYRDMKELYKLPTKVSIEEEKRQEKITKMLMQGVDPKELL